MKKSIKHLNTGLSVRQIEVHGATVIDVYETEKVNCKKYGKAFNPIEPKPEPQSDDFNSLMNNYALSICIQENHAITKLKGFFMNLN